MWCTTSYFITLYVLFATCKASPAPYRSRDVEPPRRADLLEGIRTQRGTQSEKVEDYEDVYDYMRKHEIRGVSGTEVDFPPKDQEANEVYDVEKKKNDPEMSNLIREERDQNGLKRQSDEAIYSLSEVHGITQELQKNKIEKLLSFNESESDIKLRVKRMSVLGTGGCPVGMIRYFGICFFKRTY